MTTGASFLATLWDRQEGLAEFASPTFHRTLMPKAAAVTMASEFPYYAPLLRHTHGSKKADVALTGNVVWADIDDRDAPRRIHELSAKHALVPTFLVDSGNKGFWAYFKLDRKIPTDTIEEINRGLAQLLDADTGAWNRDRLARIPGSINDNSGSIVEIVEATGLVVRPEDLEWLRVPLVSSGVHTYTDDMYEPLRGQYPLAILRPDLKTYIERHPRHGEGYDRSSVEFSIFKALAAQGFTDGEIIAYADHHQLSRHRQSRAIHGNYRWTLLSIRKARAFLEKETRTMCSTGDRYHHADRYLALASVDGETAGDTIQAIRKEQGCSEPTARRMLRQLGEGGFVTTERRGRTVIYYRTPRGNERLTRKFRSALFLPTVSSLSKGGGILGSY